MKVIKSIDQLEELAKKRAEDITKLVDSKFVAEWRHILDVANNDNDLLDLVQQDYEYFVGYGDVMGNTREIDLFQTYAMSIVDHLNRDFTFQKIVNEYTTIKNEFENQKYVISDLLINEIQTYYDYNEENAELLSAVQDKKMLKELLLDNYVLNNFVSQTFDERFNTYNFHEDLSDHIIHEISTNKNLIELKHIVENNNKHDIDFKR
jgi:hypothetical protein